MADLTLDPHRNPNCQRATESLTQRRGSESLNFSRARLLCHRPRSPEGNGLLQRNIPQTPNHILMTSLVNTVFGCFTSWGARFRIFVLDQHIFPKFPKNTQNTFASPRTRIHSDKVYNSNYLLNISDILSLCVYIYI